MIGDALEVVVPSRYAEFDELTHTVKRTALEQMKLITVSKIMTENNLFRVKNRTDRRLEHRLGTCRTLENSTGCALFPSSSGTNSIDPIPAE